MRKILAASETSKANIGSGNPSTKMPISAGQALILAIWIGILTGLGESILLTVKKMIMDQFVLLGPQVIWMSPLMNVVILTVLVAPFAIINRLKPGTISLRMILILLFSVSFLSLALMYTPLARWAAVLLSLGLAVQLSYILVKYQGLFLQSVNRSYGWMMIGLGLVTFGMVLFKP